MVERRATDLTRQMLAYSGRRRFSVVPLDVSALARENADLFRSVVPRSVMMDLRLAATRCMTEADPGQIQQVVMNLITNAAEAIETGSGTITLTTSVLTCDESTIVESRLEEKPPPGDFVCLKVADDGGGMDATTTQRIFDPFFTTKFTGRGLGMSAVLGIVRGHKGAFMVDSVVGWGTKIRVLFPVCTLRALRRMGSDVTVLLCSGFEEQDATRQFASESFSGFLQKPYLLQELKAKLEHALRGSEQAAG